MALPASGPISMSQVNTEAGDSSGLQISMTQAFSKLNNYPNSDGVNPLQMSELYDASAVIEESTISFNWSVPRVIPANDNTNVQVWVLRADDQNDPNPWGYFSLDAATENLMAGSTTRQWVHDGAIYNPPGENIFIYLSSSTLDKDYFALGKEIGIRISAHHRLSGGIKGPLITSTFKSYANPGLVNLSIPSYDMHIDVSTNVVGTYGLWVQVDIIDVFPVPPTNLVWHMSDNQDYYL